MPDIIGVPSETRAVAGRTFELGKLGMQRGVDPRTLGRGDRAALDARRLAHQRLLLMRGAARFTPIEVNETGRIADGHHSVRAAIESNVAVDVLVIPGTEPPAGPPSVQDMPVVS